MKIDPVASTSASPLLASLSGGVPVIADPVPRLESLAVTLVLDAGARFETEATSGWAHLLEHMVFKGAGGRAGREIVEAVEGEGGHVNAATGQERTSFQIRCLKGGLPLALEILADLVRRPHLEAADLEREKGVVGQEIAEAADQPDDRIFDLAQGMAFAGQPLGRPILGTVESLGPADEDGLKRFHRDLYAPKRMILSVSGAIDPDDVFRGAEDAFGDALAGPGFERPTPAAFTGGHAREARRLEQAHLVLLMNGVSRHDEDYFAMSVLTEIFGGGMSSRLFQEAREEKGLAYAIDAFQDTYEDVGLIGVYAGTAARDAAPAAALVAEELKKLARGVEAAELRRAKAQIKGGLFMGREAPLNRAEANANALHSFGRLISVGEIADRIDAVGPEDIRRAAERLASSGTASAVLGPKAALAAGEVFAETLARG